MTLERSPNPAARPVMVAFAAPSGTGKTTFITKLSRALIDCGYAVAAVKHDAHRIELDTEGKDSWRLRRSGADTILIGERQGAWFRETPTPDGGAEDRRTLIEALTRHHDVVLVEGYRDLQLPTILLGPRSDQTWAAPEGAHVLADLNRDELETALTLILERVTECDVAHQVSFHHR